jgi:hypothetical protein
VVPNSERLGFDVRAFVKQWGLNGAMGGGAHMWREVWDKYVGAVYRYELRECFVIFPLGSYPLFLFLWILIENIAFILIN